MIRIDLPRITEGMRAVLARRGCTCRTNARCLACIERDGLTKASGDELPGGVVQRQIPSSGGGADAGTSAPRHRAADALGDPCYWYDKDWYDK